MLDLKKIVSVAFLGIATNVSAELSFSTEDKEVVLNEYKQVAKPFATTASNTRNTQTSNTKTTKKQTEKQTITKNTAPAKLPNGITKNPKAVKNVATSSTQYQKTNKVNYSKINSEIMNGKHRGDTCWDSAGKYHRVDPWLLYSIAYVESNFNPNAIGKNKNGTRDIGMMQINDKVWLPKLNKMGISKQMLKDPCVSIYVGAWILRQNIDTFGYTSKAIGAYNSRTPDLNVKYAKKVYSAYSKFKKLYAMQNKK